MTTAEDSILNIDHILSRKVRDRYRTAFAQATPFHQLVVDGLFSDRILNAILGEFRRVDPGEWIRYDNENELKRGTRPNLRLGPASTAYVNAIHSGLFVDFLTSITGIDGLLPDPTLTSGGLHEIPEGGKFAVHVDFTKHPVTRLDNRLVFITYLNHDWQPSYGGALELWDADENRIAAEIQPVFGRSILMGQSARSWHSHPTPVSAPNGRCRRSIAAYYYTNGLGDADNPEYRNTVFTRPMRRTHRDKTLARVKAVTPPILLDLGKWMLRGRRGT